MDIIAYISPGTKLICWHNKDESTQYKVIYGMATYAWRDLISDNIVENNFQFLPETKEIMVNLKLTEREHITLMGLSDEIKL